MLLKGYRSKYLTDGLPGLAEHLRGDNAKDFIHGVKLPAASRGASLTARRGIASPLPLHRIHPRH